MKTANCRKTLTKPIFSNSIFITFAIETVKLSNIKIMRKALHAIFMTIALIMVFSCGKESFSDITPKPVPVPDIHEKKTAENDPIDGYYDKWVDIVSLLFEAGTMRCGQLMKLV